MAPYAVLSARDEHRPQVGRGRPAPPQQDRDGLAAVTARQGCRRPTKRDGKLCARCGR